MAETARPAGLMRRRGVTLALGAAIVGWVWGAPRLGRMSGSELVFEDIPGAPGFRSLVSQGRASVVQSLFVGLDAPDPGMVAALEQVRQAPCAALFGPAPAAVPVALFSDFNCPNCPGMDANVAAVLDRTPGTSLHRHELPLLGQASEQASRAVLAADRQGGYGAMHAALTRTPAITDTSLIGQVATRVGLDADRLIRDMADPQIAGALTRSRALSQMLGLPGTPAAVIGTTAVLGVIPEATIAAVIEDERSRGRTCPA